METLNNIIANSLGPVTLIQLIGAILLYERYLYSKQRDKDDRGLLWLAWSFIIVVPYFALYSDVDLTSTTNLKPVMAALCSFANNIFLLLAYPYFMERTELLNNPFTGKPIKIGYKYYNLIVGVFAAIVLFLTGVTCLIAIMAELDFSKNSWFHLHEWPNTVMSVLVLCMIGQVVIRSFRRSKRPILVGLGYVTFLLIILMQFYYILPEKVLAVLGGEEAIKIYLAPLTTSIKIVYLFLITQVAVVAVDRNLENVERTIDSYVRFIAKPLVTSLGGPAQYPLRLHIPYSNQRNSEMVSIDIYLTFREYYAYVLMLSARHQEQEDGDRDYFVATSLLNPNDLGQLRTRLENEILGQVEGSEEDVKDLVANVIIEHLAGRVRLRLPVRFENEEVLHTIAAFNSYSNSPAAALGTMDYVQPVIAALQSLVPDHQRQVQALPPPAQDE